MTDQQIARRELRRALRIHPHWIRFREDLLQDALEAILRTPIKDGGYASVAARGAIVRRALEYFGVNSHTGYTPINVTIDDHLADTLPAQDHSRAEFEVIDMQRYLLARAAKEHGARGSRILETELERDTASRAHGSGSDLAQEFNVTRQAVSLWRKRIMKDVERWYREAA